MGDRLHHHQRRWHAATQQGSTHRGLGARWHARSRTSGSGSEPGHAERWMGTTLRFYDTERKVWRITWVSPFSRAVTLLEGHGEGQKNRAAGRPAAQQAALDVQRYHDARLPLAWRDLARRWRHVEAYARSTTCGALVSLALQYFLDELTYLPARRGLAIGEDHDGALTRRDPASAACGIPDRRRDGAAATPCRASRVASPAPC